MLWGRLPSVTVGQYVQLDRMEAYPFVLKFKRQMSFKKGVGPPGAHSGE